MNWVECLLILAGASMEIFAAMICHGSVIQKVNRKEMLIICTIVTTGQTFAAFLGYLAASQYFSSHPDLDGSELGEILAAAMMLFMGIRLVFKAIRRETMVERLEKNFKALKFVRLTLYTAGYTLLSGLAFGCMGTSLLLMLLMQVVLTLSGIIAGVYTGYHYGFAPKIWAYAAGTLLFWSGSAGLILHDILEII